MDKSNENGSSTQYDGIIMTDTSMHPCNPQAFTLSTCRRQARLDSSCLTGHGMAIGADGVTRMYYVAMMNAMMTAVMNAMMLYYLKAVTL